MENRDRRLAISKGSAKVRKPASPAASSPSSVSSSPSCCASSARPAPKVVNADPGSFRRVVQELTGSGGSAAAAAAASASSSSSSSSSSSTPTAAASSSSSSPASASPPPPPSPSLASSTSATSASTSSSTSCTINPLTTTHGAFSPPVLSSMPAAPGFPSPFIPRSSPTTRLQRIAPPSLARPPPPPPLPARTFVDPQQEPSYAALLQYYHQFALQQGQVLLNDGGHQSLSAVPQPQYASLSMSAAGDLYRPLSSQNIVACKNQTREPESFAHAPPSLLPMLSPRLLSPLPALSPADSTWANPLEAIAASSSLAPGALASTAFVTSFASSPLSSSSTPLLCSGPSCSVPSISNGLLQAQAPSQKTAMYLNEYPPAPFPALLPYSLVSPPSTSLGSSAAAVINGGAILFTANDDFSFHAGRGHGTFRGRF